MIEGLVTGKELVRAKNLRLKTYNSMKVLKGNEKQYLDCGWEKDKELKREIKLKKEKSIDEQFENYVWTIFYRLGFLYMNEDRKFTISYGDGKGCKQQVDVFAADDETALVIECKSTRTRGKVTSFKKQIESIGGQKEKIIRKINSEGKKRKVKFIFATKNYELSSVDRDRLNDFDIEYFDEDILEYYKELSSHLGNASRFQLLGQLFRGKKISEMDNKIPAIRGKMGGKEYYEFSIEPEKLLKMGYVLHRSNSNKVELPSYQRIVKRSRLKKVKEFVEKGGFFPNSIVVNINTSKVQFDLVKAKHDSDVCNLGVLTLPHLYRSLYIIDGQHRLYGYSDSNYSKKNTIPVVAFVNLSKEEQVKLFMEINENQKSVSKNLQNTLNADLLWGSEDKNDQAKAIGLKLAQWLGEVKDSPLFGKFVYGEDKANENTFLKMESVTEAIKKTGYINKYSKKNDLIDNGIFDKNDNQKTLEFLFNYFSSIFNIVKTRSPKEWDLGKEGILLTNVGISAFIRIFYEVLLHIEKEEGIKVLSETYESLVDFSRPYIEVVCDYINNANDEDRKRIKKLYGSGSKTFYQRFMQVVINQSFPTFRPKGIEGDIIEFHKTYNEYGQEIIPKLRHEIRSRFENCMVRQFGYDWTKKLPKNVYKKAAQRQIERNYDLGTNDKEYSIEDVLTLNDYASTVIYQSYWRDFFEEYFALPVDRKRRMAKDKKIEWLRRLAKLNGRNLLEYSINSEEKELLEKLEKWLLLKS